MATYKGKDILFKIGDGADPEVFAAPCGLIANVTFESETSEYVDVDCDNPDEVPWKSQVKTARSVSIEGEGIMKTVFIQAWFDFFNSDDPVNCELIIPDVGTYRGAFNCNNLSFGGQREEVTNLSASVSSSGKLELVP